MFIERIDRILKRYPLSLVILAAIIYLSFFKPPKTDLNEIKNIDKLAHLLMYGGFCVILWAEYFMSHSKSNARNIFWGAIIGPILFSGAIELLQELTTEYRGGDWMDFLFNTLGVLLAALFSIYVTKPIMKKHKLLNCNRIE